MEFKDRKNHYLHPDFEDVDTNSEKKPSPLALLAQTCKNVGSIKENADGFFYHRNQSPNSSLNGFRKLSKRCLSDTSSNSSSTDRDYLSPIKKTRLDNKIQRKKKPEIIEFKSADTSSETSFNSGNTSLISNLIDFVKNSHNSRLMENDKIELINFLAEQKNNKDRCTNLSKKSNQFNVEKGYHLDTVVESTKHVSVPVSKDYSPRVNHESTNPADGVNASQSSAIKYCMYCGKCIPILPLLLTHIRMEHANSNFTDPNVNQFSSPNLPHVYDMFSKFNPYFQAGDVKSNQTFSFLTDYINSSFKGLNNLIC